MWSTRIKSILGVGAVAASVLIGVTPAGAKPAPQATIRVARSTYTLGQAIAVSGTVKRAHRGRVTIQELPAGGRWATAATVRVSARGTFHATLYVSRAGRFAFRVVRPKRHKISRAVSPAASITVFRYHYLADLSPIDWAGGKGTGASEINGVTYAHSVTYRDLCYYGSDCGESTTVATYNLRRQCVTLDGVAGLDDRSSTADQDELELTLDSGQPSFDQSFGIGDSSAFHLNLRGQLRLTLTESASDSGPENTAAFGNARIYCAF